MRQILIAIPNYKGYLAEDVSQSLGRLLRYVPEEGEPQIQWATMILKGCAVLPRVRNYMATFAMDKNFEGILFIDDDIGFEPKDVYRMIGRNIGLVGAVPQKRNHKWNDPATLAIPPLGMEFYKVNGEYDLGKPFQPRLPMAMTFIATQVLREIRDAGLAPSFIYTPNGEPQLCYKFFGYELSEAPEWSWEYKVGREQFNVDVPMCEDGEDHYFCRLADKVGYPSLIDLNFELRHWEGQVLHDYSFKKFLAEFGGKMDVRTEEYQPPAINAAEAA